MIKQTKKRCIDCGSLTYIWSHKKCKRCDALYRARERRSTQKGTNVPSNKDRPQNRSYTPLNRMSDKRRIEAAQYKTICDEMDLVKPHICFLCGKEVKGRPDHHHLSGRWENYLKEDLIVKAHGKCHRQYHDDPVESIEWFDDFLLMLKQYNFQLYQRELYKLDK